jgi:hypothetical protein
MGVSLRGGGWSILVVKQQALSGNIPYNSAQLEVPG